jgi:hypothetical protein
MATTPDHSPADDAQQPKANPSNSGHNDNPDEFSEFRKPDAPATENYASESEQADPARQPGHVEQNQDPEAVRATQNADNDKQREAWAADDPRYGSGPRPEPQDEK